MTIGIRLMALCLSLLGCTSMLEHSLTSENQTVAASDPRISVMGRTQTLADGGLQFGYPGVTLSFGFRGNSLTMLASSSKGKSYIEVLVDGQIKKVPIPAVQAEIPLFSDSKVAQHKVTLIHSSETWHGLVSVQSFTVGDGALTKGEDLPKRKILVVGDSITCGEAIDRPSSSALCGVKQTSWWSPRLSYGMLIAEELRAQVQLVCMGGRGLIRSWNGNTEEQQAPAFYDLAITNGGDSVVWDQSQYSANLVIIALGTNDFSHSAGPMPEYLRYVSAYTDLLNKVLRDHPAAQIILTEGPVVSGKEKQTLLGYLADVKRIVGSDRVSLVSSQIYSGDACDFHPTKEQHHQMTRDLMPSIKAVTHW